MDLKAGTPPTRITTGKNFLYSGEVYNDKLYVTTNEDAPRYRVFVADAGNFDREAWKELIPQTDAVLQGTAVFGGKLFAQYEQNATSQLKSSISTARSSTTSAFPPSARVLRIGRPLGSRRSFLRIPVIYFRAINLSLRPERWFHFAVDQGRRSLHRSRRL